MKTIITLLIILSCMTAFSQKYGVECPTLDLVANLSAGAPFNVRAEVGLQGWTFGASAGIKSYVQYHLPKPEGKPQPQPILIAPFIKGYIEILGNEDTDFRIYFSGYGGWKIFGAGTKVCYILDDNLMVTLEPAYTYESRLEVDAGLNFRF